MDMTTMHLTTLRRIEAGLLIAPTSVVQELTAAGFVTRDRYVYTASEAGWKYNLTDSGRALLNPQPKVQGSTKRLSQAATWMD